MHGFKGERTLMRIHIGERDKYQGKPLYRAIVELLRERHYAGATALRGIMSFGASSKLHTDRVELLSLDLPVIIECVETEERIRAILPELDVMIGGGLITLERAKVILYRHDLRRTAPDQAVPPGGRERRSEEIHDDWRTEITGRWQPDDPPKAP
jgi:PII-like signaling protein